MKKLTVEFEARFKATIEVDDEATEEEIHDAVCDIDIPENNQCKYVSDSFEPDEPEEVDEPDTQSVA